MWHNVDLMYGNVYAAYNQSISCNMINQELCVVKYFYLTTLVFQQNVVQRHAWEQLENVSGSFQASVSILVNLVQANIDVNSLNTSTVVVMVTLT